MKPILLGGNRAALQFLHDGGDVDATQERAMFGATRSNILKEWRHFPKFMRQDQGFQCLMDTYCPVDEETLEFKRRERTELALEYLRGVLGNHFKPGDAATDEEIIAALRAIPQHNACVDMALPFGNAGTAVATNSTSRTVAGMQPRANQSVRMWGFDIGFDGTTSTNGPGIVEIVNCTFATNPPSTNSVTSLPVIIDFSRPETVQTTGAKAWTVEPTVIVTTEVFFIPNYMGSGIVFTPLTKPFGLTSTKGGLMRVTQASGITGNATGTLKAEEMREVPHAAFGGENFRTKHCYRPITPVIDQIII